MERQRSRNRSEAAKLEMTPMIDVVFQLLIFFIVTLKQEDILSHLDVSRPSTDKTRPPDTPVDDLLTIEVYRDGFIMQGRRMPLGTLARRLKKLSDYSKDVPVIIKCTKDSPHGNLIKLLNVCARAELHNLSVFSM